MNSSPSVVTCLSFVVFPSFNGVLLLQTNPENLKLTAPHSLFCWQSKHFLIITWSYSFHCGKPKLWFQIKIIFIVQTCYRTMLNWKLSVCIWTVIFKSKFHICCKPFFRLTAAILRLSSSDTCRGRAAEIAGCAWVDLSHCFSNLLQFGL